MLIEAQKEEFYENIFNRLNVKNQLLKDAVNEYDRKLFIPEGIYVNSYKDEPIPIGFRQTLSAPSTIIRMLKYLYLTGKEKVLEIGTGSGYQTAVLSSLSKKVYSVERIKQLFEKAKNKLIYDLKIKNIMLYYSDGSIGLKENAPFQRIIVNANSPSIPDTLLEQLDENGILVAPVGQKDHQVITVFRKSESGEITVEPKEKANFVPLIGDKGY